MLASLDVFDKRLMMAAAGLCAPPSSAVWHVTLPIVAPGILSGAILALLTSFDEIVIGAADSAGGLHEDDRLSGDGKAGLVRVTAVV